MPHSIIIPITNVYAKGDYCAQVHIGSHQQIANLILDTGSSTLVVQHKVYQADSDTHLQATEFVQDITYGMGGWYGPVIKTSVSMGQGLFHAALNDVHIAITKVEETGCFGSADGLLGLAYDGLNRAYDLSHYLQINNINPATTYHWYLAPEQQHDSVREFRQFVHHYPNQLLSPYFNQLKEQGVVANQFAFVVHRSSIYQTDSQQDIEQLKQHPLNNGYFILGKPKLHKHIYQGEFKAVKVLHDKYYNINLLSMQVGEQTPFNAPPLTPQEISGYVSNAIVDSGASKIMLPAALFSHLYQALIIHNADFAQLLQPFAVFDGSEQGIAMDNINFSEWPDIHFIFEGFDNQHITLTLTPHTYWQTHAPAPKQISLQFVTLPNWPNQSVMGLPLLNNYFTIFDRAEKTQGAVLFADKAFSPHRLSDDIHNNMAKLNTLIKQHCPVLLMSADAKAC